MPSFDVVNRLDFQEIDNAIANVTREITNRYDFKGSETSIERKENDLTVVTDDELKLNQVHDLIITHLVRRKVDPLCLSKKSAEKDTSNFKLTPMIVETKDIDVTNNEAVMKDGKSIGYITSGGYAHYVKKSIAYCYLDKEILKTNEKLEVEINGDFYKCSILKEPLYDPTGTKMRS